MLVLRNEMLATVAQMSVIYCQQRGGSTTSDLSALDWEQQQNTFLVCIHNVAQDQPYSILQAPMSSAAQDIITQVLYSLFKIIIITQVFYLLFMNSININPPEQNFDLRDGQAVEK